MGAFSRSDGVRLLWRLMFVVNTIGRQIGFSVESAQGQRVAFNAAQGRIPPIRSRQASARSRPIDGYSFHTKGRNEVGHRLPSTFAPIPDFVPVLPALPGATATDSGAGIPTISAFPHPYSLSPSPSSTTRNTGTITGTIAGTSTGLSTGLRTGLSPGNKSVSAGFGGEGIRFVPLQGPGSINITHAALERDGAKLKPLNSTQTATPIRRPTFDLTHIAPVVPLNRQGSSAARRPANSLLAPATLYPANLDLGPTKKEEKVEGGEEDREGGEKEGGRVEGKKQTIGISPPTEKEMKLPALLMPSLANNIRGEKLKELSETDQVDATAADLPGERVSASSALAAFKNLATEEAESDLLIIPI